MRMTLFIIAAIACVLLVAAPSDSDDKPAAEVPLTQGYSTSFEYYILGEASVRQIDTVNAPMVVIQEN